jgi:hypothetical protein
MTRVFGPPQHRGEPKTHVLIIGVSRYRHLIGGAAQTPTLPPLGQLTSPTVSARALAEWFTQNKLTNRSAPLGSVELVLSDPAGQQFNGTAVEDATMDNIQNAFDAWYDRCDALEGNTAILYFCGHGLQKDAMVLLPEDFGQSRHNRWANAIDFDRTYRGMGQCQAKTQLYILDACRQLSQIATLDLDASGRPLKTAVLNKLRPRTAPRLFATAIGLPAFGDNGQVSRLTAALIDCLDGLGAAQNPNGRWIIDTDHLGGAVQKLIEHRNKKLPETEQQSVDPAGGENAKGPQGLHALPPSFVPRVTVTMSCDPDCNTPMAKFHATPGKGPKQSAPANGAWQIELQAGSYTFGCVLNGGRTCENPEVFVLPPVWGVIIEI